MPSSRNRRTNAGGGKALLLTDDRSITDPIIVANPWTVAIANRGAETHRDAFIADASSNESKMSPIVPTRLQR